MKKLKNCPFCGGEPETISFVNYHPVASLTRPACFIQCMECGIRTSDFVAEDMTFRYKDEAEAAWNRRAENGKID